MRPTSINGDGEEAFMLPAEEAQQPDAWEFISSIDAYGEPG